MRRSFTGMAALTIAACTAVRDDSPKRSSSVEPPNLMSSAMKPCVSAIVVGRGFTPRDVNERGDVVGTRHLADGSSRAFAWRGGTTMELPSLGGRETTAIRVNDRGDIIGSSQFPGKAHARAVQWRDGALTELGTLGGAYSNAIDLNEQGQIVGNAALPDGKSHAFLWQDGKMIDLGTLGGDESGATAINERGQVIGWSKTPPPVELHAFFWENGAMRDLGHAFGAIDLNGRGEAVVQGVDHASFWRDGMAMDVTPFEDGSMIFIHDLDDRGRVVGSALLRGGREVGFLWEEGAVTRIGSDKFEGYVTPTAINANGLVVGFTAGAWGGRAFMWTDGVLSYLAEDEESSVALAVNDRGHVIGTSGTKGMLWIVGSCAEGRTW